MRHDLLARPLEQRRLLRLWPGYVGGFLIFLAIPTIFLIGLLPGLMPSVVPARLHRHPDDPSQPVVLAHEQAIMISKRPPKRLV